MTSQKRKSAIVENRAARSRESLRQKYKPARVRILFVGEAPPASGRFFYQADSGLYRAIRLAFVTAIPTIAERNFLRVFQALGCYLVDLCGTPVDDLDPGIRCQKCTAGEVRLSETLTRLQPKIVVVLLRSISSNVKRAGTIAGWSGTHIEVPYPGRWYRHRAAFMKTLVPMLRALNQAPGYGSFRFLCSTKFFFPMDVTFAEDLDHIPRKLTASRVLIESDEQI